MSEPRLGTRHRGTSAGFTLLEILVALVVLGLLIVGLTQGMRLGMQVWDRQRRALNAADQFDATDRALRGLIEQMEPGALSETFEIVGTPHTLRFITLMPQEPGALPTRRASVMLFVGPRQRLLLRWAPRPHVKPLAPVLPVEIVLLDGVDHIDIEYESGAPAARWEAVWRSRNPPLLVRIHIAFAPTDPRRWPDLVAASMRERGGS